MSEEHARRWAGEGAPVELVECVTLAHVLEKSAVDVVDFMSVDVEGGERDPHTHTYTYAITHELSVRAFLSLPPSLPSFLPLTPTSCAHARSLNISLLSLAGELDALFSIDWGRVMIRVLVVERNHGDAEIERLLLAQGMVLVRELASNRVWCHPSMVSEKLIQS